MKLHLIIVGLLLITVCIALAQDNPKRIEPIQPVTPIPEEPKKGVKPELKPPVGVTPMPESQPQPEKRGLQPVSPISGMKESMPQYAPMGLNPASPVQPLDGMNYQVQEFKDFTGGWNISTYKTKLALNESPDLENALWNPMGEMYKRPGYSEHSTPPFIANFLYRYYQQDGDKWLMGGSDTSLYFWHEDSSGDGWTYLIGTEGTSGRWDGTTFDDLFVGTHEGVEPYIWDGERSYPFGESVDSFRIVSVYPTTPYSSTPCYHDSARLTFDEGWDVHEWAEYTLICPRWFRTDVAEYETVMTKSLIVDNTSDLLYCRPHDRLESGWIVEDSYARILSYFQRDSIWRTGTIDSVRDVIAGEAHWCVIAIHDSSFYWDSTFQYGDYIFEVVDGAGKGAKTYLSNWTWGAGFYMGETWDTAGFFVASYGADCFDTTSVYEIYKPVALGTGAKFCENWEDALWIGWTGIGEEQEKNRLVFSAPGDIGNWPPENNIYIESDDGDFITGMIVFEPEGAYRQTPYAELLVGKNQSLYRVFPYYMTGNELDYKTIQVSTHVGVCSDKGMANVEGRFVLFPDQHGVYAYDGKVQEIPISAKIDPVFEGWNFEELEKVSAVYNPQDRHYYLSYAGIAEWDTDPFDYEGFIVAYDADIVGADSLGLFTNKFSSSGAKLRSQFNNLPYQSGYTDIAIKDNGDYVMTWTEYNGPDISDLWLQRFNWLDETVGDSILISDTSTTTGSWPSIAMNNGGDIVVCWDDARGATDGVYCQCVDFDTGRVGNNFQVNANARDPDVAINDNGSFVIVFNSVAAEDIYAQRYNGYNDPYDTAFLVSFSHVDTNYSGGSPAVAVGEDNRWVCVWRCYVYGPSHFDIYIHGFDSSQNEYIPNTLVNTEDAGRTHDLPDISMNNSGKFVVVWHKDSGSPPSDMNIFGRRFRADGTTVGSQFEANDDSVGTDPDDPDKYAAVALNNRDIFMVIWEEDGHVSNDDIYGQVYNWSYAVGANFPVNDDVDDESVTRPRITVINNPVGPSAKTLAWSIDFRGWSKESFEASAYCYQHSTTDDVKILFADPTEYAVQNYGTQADDGDQPVMLTYQSPYVEFSQYPSFNYQMRFATLEAYLDTGTVYLDWYKDYGDLTYQDSIVCGTDCREEMTLPDTLRGKNISMELRTGSTIDDFTLSRFWWEGVPEPNRK